MLQRYESYSNDLIFCNTCKIIYQLEIIFLKQGLSKKESLKSKKYFDAIFAQGKSVKAYPIRAIYIALDQDNFPDVAKMPTLSQVAFSVPKKKFKLAVHRNRIKRQMREAYRLNKTLLDKPYAIIFVYLPKEQLSYTNIDEAMQNILSAMSGEDRQLP